MEPQLKQRLIGVTIVVALVVIFVPMLFEKSDDKGRFNTSGIPPVPSEVLEQPLELPKSAEELAPKKEELDKVPEEKGYKIVPLNEEYPPKAEVLKKEAAAAKATTDEADVEDEAPPEPTAPVVQADKPVAVKVVKVDKTKSASKDKPQTRPSAKTGAVEPKQNEDQPVAAVEPISARQPEKIVTVKPKPVLAAKTPVEVKKAMPLESPKPLSRPKLPNTPTESTVEDIVSAQGKSEVASPKPKVKAAPVVKAEVAGAIKNTVQTKPGESAKPVPVPATASPEKKAPATPVGNSPPPSSKPVAELKSPPKSPATWNVQAGSFADENNAKALADKLKQSKIPAYVETQRGAKGNVYKVRVGAEMERARAEETLKQIESSSGVNGIMTQHR